MARISHSRLLVNGEANGGVQSDYYPVGALARDSFAVYFLLPEGDVVGFRITRRNGRIVYYVRRTDGTAEALPDFAAPTLFRPISLARYPDPLPLPATLLKAVSWESPPPPPVAPEAPNPLEWPHAYSLPGQINREEAWIRLRRGLLTERSANTQVGRGRPRNIDSVLRLILKTMGKLEYEHIESAAALHAIGEPWSPTRRDHGDWPIALSWFTQLSARERDIVRFRSLLPPYSFQQIGDRLAPKITRSTAKEAFERALDEVTKIANMVRAT